METETFQHYQILRRDDGSLWELGRGAMAVTYKALDNNLRCPVALKVVDAADLDDEHTRARFVREARAAAALRHRNIATVYHLGSDGQKYFYAMEFVDGETVEDRVVRRGPLPPAEALGIAAQVARALGAAAREGLVHRDIKPANLMLTREDDDEALLVKVIDFGLARRAVASDQTARITVSGFVGTPHYASPEQIEERDIDCRSDIYSLGVTLWFMLTGGPTFTGPAAQIGSQHLGGEPPWAVVAHLPAPLRALLARTLQKKPADRPQTPSILRHEIDTCLGELTAGEVPATGETIIQPQAAEATPTPLPDAPPDEPDAVPQGPAPVAGEFFGERFHLLDLAGEGSTGQVFRATDARHADRPVALKVIRPELGLDRRELHRLRSDLRRLRAAPHPRLIEVFALDQARGFRFLASEWIDGFTLVDLLRHRGRLELPEALRLLEDASDAAAHGSANGLRRLELTSHQILVHFPAGFEGVRAGAVRKAIDRPLAKWPEFGLKIDAIAPARETDRTPTWAGAMTLVPASPQRGRGTPSRVHGPAAGSYLYPLGTLCYEMLNGTPPPGVSAGGRDAPPPLPMLGEEANAVLRRALSANPGFRDEREFFDALLTASGLERGDLRFRPKSGAKILAAPPAGEATVVPPSERVIVAAHTVPVDPPLALRMAPTIRTTLLRPRHPRPTKDAMQLAARPPRWILPAGIAGLLMVAAVCGYFLLPKRPAPPRNGSAQPSAAPMEEADSPAAPASPAPADETPPAPR